MDDIICFADSLEQLKGIITSLLSRCREHGITLSESKFTIGHEVKYAGYIIGESGVRADPRKLEAIANFPLPTNRSELRSFFGLLNQLSSFAPGMKMIFGPLRGLLSEKNAWQWLDDHSQAFEKIKQALVSPPILSHFDSSLDTALLTDASKLHGIGFVLMQNHGSNDEPLWKLIQAGSRFISDTESRYSVCELELLAIQQAVEDCRFYLLGLPHFNVITDHRPLVSICNGTSLDALDNRRLQRILEKLMPYVFTVIWKKGKHHCIADALSRAPVSQPAQEEDDLDLRVQNILCSDPTSETEKYDDLALAFIRDTARNDGAYQDIISAIKHGKDINKLPQTHPARPFMKDWDNISIQDGLLILNGHRIIIPREARQEILTRLHFSHQGITRTRARARELFAWPGLSNDVAQLVSNCELCQLYKPSQCKEPLQSDPMPTRPFQSSSADLFEYGGKHFLVYVDRFSNWPCIAMFNKVPNTSDVTKALRGFFRDFGIPITFKSDGGPQFTSKEFRDFCKSLSIRAKNSSPHYAQSNGHAEATVKSIKALVKRYWSNGRLDIEAFDYAILELRNMPLRDGKSPAQWLFGRPIRTQVPAQDSFYSAMLESDVIHGQEKRFRQTNKTKRIYDESSRSLPPLSVGSSVWIQNTTNNLWDKMGVIEGIRQTDRSYIVVVPGGGRAYIRNRRYLRPVAKIQESSDLFQKSNNIPQEKTLRRSTRSRVSPQRFGF